MVNETDPNEKPRWAPRVPLKLIRRLYESDARGLLDEDLLDDIGLRLYRRCESILTIQFIQDGGPVPCAHCGSQVPRLPDRDEVLRCESCSWELPWAAYWSTFRHQELAGDLFIQDFMGDWQAARTPRVKILAIDRVIHRWHNAEQMKRPGYGVGRPAGVNLLEGSRRQVLQFLEELTFGSGVAAASSDRARWMEIRKTSAWPITWSSNTSSGKSRGQRLTRSASTRDPQ